MHSVSKLGVERLHLNFSCGKIPTSQDINLHRNTFFEFSLELLAQASSLKSLFLSVCVVQPSVTLRLNSLKNLFLTSVLLKIGQLEGILSSCLNLNQLVIKYCKLPHELCIFGTVKSVLFADCGGLEEIDLQATKLHGFECFFNNRQHKTYRQNARGSPIRPPLSPRDHTELKEVRFGGFHGTEEEIELAIYILKSATVLDQMFLSQYSIDPYFKAYYGRDIWKKREQERILIHRRLLGQAISSSTVVHDASELPDDVLSSILSRMTIKDAVKTSILSTRWRYLFASMPTLQFGLDMFGFNYSVKSVLFADCGGLEEIDLQATKLCEFEWFFDDKVRFYFSSVPVLERVKISLRGDASMPNIFGEFAVNLPAQVKYLIVTACYTQQHKTYRRKSSGSRIRPPLSPTDHTELKEVRFGGFHGTKEEIELAIYILSSATVHEAKVDYASQLPDEILSSILSRITIKDAVKTSILSRRWRYLVASMPTLKFSLDMIGVNSSHHRCCPYSQQKFLKVVNQFLQHYSGRKVVGLLTSVLFADCGGLEEIDLQATNLRGFVCFCDQKVRFYLSSVPVLERVQLSLRGDASMPYILGEFARDQVKSLIVTASDTQVTHFPTETRIFRNLTMLALLLVNTHYFDIVKVSPILNACPVLEYLDLLWETYRQNARGSHIRSSLSPTYHAKLKEVRFGGFHGKGEEIELAIYILISAMVLDHMFLSQYSIGSYFTACNGRVILELLALGGLDFLRTRLLSKKEEKASTKVDEAKVDYASQDYASQLSDAHEAKVDYASQLPDDVLSLILSRMTTKDAVKTSILSTRWRYLFASMPTLQFSLDMFGVNYSGHTSQQKLMKTVNQFLQFYLGRKIVDLEMHMVIKREVFYSGAFAQLMHSISKLGVERLLLNFSCGKIPTSKYINLHHNTFYEFPLELLSKASSLKSLSLSDCAVRPSVRLRLNSLKNLYLTSVLLKSGQLEGILSSRVNPNQLVIKYCKLPHKLCISGTVKFVLFADCGGLEEIDLQATNLHGFRGPIYGSRKSVDHSDRVAETSDHPELKEVRFGGFHGTEEEIELAIYILKSATVLNQMFLSQYPIDPYFKAYYGHDIWEKREGECISIHRRLRGQAISSSTVVIIQ
ncbi:hypothetical protein FXO38_34518 [Capsicum annuum]|nr:hypothetical protein FXO38_34518 [Capsicum annuum]